MLGTYHLMNRPWRALLLGFRKGSPAADRVLWRYTTDGVWREAQGPQGLDNLLYSADADFSCFADLALTSPAEYYKEGEGSLLQCVITPADPYMPLPNEQIIERIHKQVCIVLHMLLCLLIICMVKSCTPSGRVRPAWFGIPVHREKSKRA